MTSKEKLEQLAMESGIDLTTLNRFMVQVAGDLKNATSPTAADVSQAIDNRHTRNMEIIDDCIAHPKEAAELVFSGFSLA